MIGGRKIDRFRAKQAIVDGGDLSPVDLADLGDIVGDMAGNTDDTARLP